VTAQARELLRMQLIRHEGLRLFPYRDSVGKLTIGVGRNLDDVGIAAVEAYQLLDNDIDRTVSAMTGRWPTWFLDLDPPRQAALVNMAFNLGVTGFAAFTQTIAALERHDYAGAAAEMLGSRWATQVRGRALELADQVRTGAWSSPAKR
jgi:lysozyme